MKKHWKIFASLFFLYALSLFLVPSLLSMDTKKSGQTVPLIDRELFFGNPAISGTRLSPDGTKISFLKSHNGILNIWIKDLEESFEAARPVTNETTRSITSYFWSRDGKYILYDQDVNGNENDHLFAIDLAIPGKAVDLTPFSNTQVRVVSAPKETPHILCVEYNDRDERYHDLYRLDITTGKRELLQENTLQIGSWIVDLKGEPKLALRQSESGENELYRIDRDGLALLFATSKDDCFMPIRFCQDGHHCYALTNRNVDRKHLVLLDIATGVEEVVDEGSSSEVDMGGAFFSAATNELIATSYTDDRYHLIFKNSEWARDYNELKEKLPSGDVFITSTTADEGMWIVAFTSDREPGSVYLYDRNRHASTLLYQARPELPREQLASMRPFTFTARDGLEIHAYLTVPKRLPEKRLPLVVCPHGGPWVRDTWGYDAEVQFLSNRGYCVLQLNYRGSTGYGKQFMNAGKRQWGDAMQNDITDGVHFLVDQGIVDPCRVAISGGSYGGYAALAGLAFTPDVYCAGVSIVGPSNLLTLLSSIPAYWVTEHGFTKEHIGDLDDPVDVVRLKRQSPLFSVNRIRAPLLVVQGANDPRVKKAESDQIVSALHSLGREVQYLVAPDEGHGFLGEENRKALAVAMERFFAAHLGGRCQQTVPSSTLTQLNALTVDASTVVAQLLPLSSQP